MIKKIFTTLYRKSFILHRHFSAYQRNSETITPDLRHE